MADTKRNKVHRQSSSAQKEHRRLKSVHQIQKRVQVVSRNAGGGEYMGKFSAQETPTLLCKCWAKRNREETTTKEVRGGRIDRGCVCRSICDFCFFKKICLKHVYIRKRITERNGLEIRYGFTNKILQGRKKN